jgi:hypothetical protein
MLKPERVRVDVLRADASLIGSIKNGKDGEEIRKEKPEWKEHFRLEL